MRPVPASAQYFGRNKVQYKTLDFQILKTEHFDIYFPLLPPFGASQGMYGPLPVEVAFFADGGLAWNSLQQATIATSPLGVSQASHPFDWRDGVASAAVALRVNLFGFAIGQLDFAHPFQRPGRGWVFSSTCRRDTELRVQGRKAEGRKAEIQR